MKPFVTQSFHAHLHIVGFFFSGEGTITSSLWCFRRLNSGARAVLSDWVTGRGSPLSHLDMCGPRGYGFLAVFGQK